MKVPAPPLLPVLRSRLVGDLLALLLADPDRSWTLDELAERAGASYQTVTREVRRLQDADLVRSTSVGRSKLLKANPQNPYLSPLTDLVLASFGPPLVVAEELADVTGIERVLIYGSWAARHAGERGRTPRDVDVLIIGEPDRDAVYDAAQRATRRLGVEVNSTIRTAEAWDGATDSFAMTVRSSPVLEVPGPWTAEH